MKRKQTLPTKYETRMLRLIAQSGRLMLTMDADGKALYSDGNGTPIAERTARTLIHNGWVKPERDSMFGTDPQSWLALKP